MKLFGGGEKEGWAGERRFGRESFKAVGGFGPRLHRGFLG